MNLDRLITKICNSLQHSRSHWQWKTGHAVGFELINTQMGWTLWVANQAYGLTLNRRHLDQQACWMWQSQLEQACRARNCGCRTASWASMQLPPDMKERLWQAVCYWRDHEPTRWQQGMAQRIEQARQHDEAMRRSIRMYRHNAKGDS